jgi:uncharacterized membrane protein YfcA
MAFVTFHNAGGIFLAGILTGVMGAILGTGGGVFLIPILVLGFGIPMHYAIATSILSVIATSSAVASANVERGTANMKLGMTLEVATALGAISGGITAGRLSSHALEFLFALVILPTAFFMWRGRTEHEFPDDGDSVAKGGNGEASTSRHADLSGEYYDEAVKRPVRYEVQRLPAGLGISFLAGSLSGLLGIGGGVFKVPAMHMLCGIPIKAAAATSNFMIGVTAAASAFLYYGRGEVRTALTSAAVLGILCGSVAGSRLNRHIQGHAVKKMFALLLFAVAIQMFCRAFLGEG